MGSFLPVVISLAILSSACSRDTDRLRPAELPAQLVVMPRAERIRPVIRPDGIRQVSYDLRMPFPAAALFQAITRALPSETWKPLPNDMLNADLPSSHVRGWGEFIDGTQKPNTDVRLWMAQWRDPTGNVVLYALRYDSAHRTDSVGPKEPDNDHLKVNAAWYPAQIAKQMVEQAAKVRNRL